MAPTALLPAILVASLVTTPLLAGEHDRRQDPDPRRTPATGRSLQDMHPVPIDTNVPAPSQGWQYFSDPATLHAVVISPKGDYYFSRGKGLRWVAAAQTAR